jgi:hypothetical protein
MNWVVWFTFFLCFVDNFECLRERIRFVFKAILFYRQALDFPALAIITTFFIVLAVLSIHIEIFVAITANVAAFTSRNTF